MKYLIRLFQFFLLVAFFLSWELSARYGIIDDFIFSSPTKLFSCMIGMAIDQSLLTHISTTLFETIVSFFLVIVFTLFLTTVLWLIPPLSRIIEPYLVVLNSLPKSALAPLLIVWLGANTKTIVIAGMSVAIFGSIMNLYTAFQETDPDKIKLIYTLHGTKRHVLQKVVLPGNINNIFSIMRVNIGLCLVGVIIGEFIGSKQGLGYLIIYGSQVFQLDWVLMSILILCIIAVLLYSLLGFAEKLWMHSGKKN